MTGPTTYHEALNRYSELIHTLTVLASKDDLDSSDMSNLYTIKRILRECEYRTSYDGAPDLIDTTPDWIEDLL